jgi:hypothetical protein
LRSPLAARKYYRQSDADSSSEAVVERLPAGGIKFQWLKLLTITTNVAMSMLLIDFATLKL